MESTFEKHETQDLVPEDITFENTNKDDMDQPWNEIWRMEFLKNIQIQLDKERMDEVMRHGIEKDDIHDKEKQSSFIKGCFYSSKLTDEASSEPLLQCIDT